VLNDERRVITQMGMLAALGISQGGAGWAKGQGDGLGRFLTSDALSPFVSSELLNLISDPIKFRIKVRNAGMRRAFGYEATTLPDICEAVLNARAEGKLRHQQMRIGNQCELLARGFMRIGIIALVDEATGYQKQRAQDALAEILEQFIAKELRPYIRLFPTEFTRTCFACEVWSFQKIAARSRNILGI
jgi:hypothetical protein